MSMLFVQRVSFAPPLHRRTLRKTLKLWLLSDDVEIMNFS